VLLLSPVEMKTSYESLHKLAQVYNCGGITYGGLLVKSCGYAGGAGGIHGLGIRLHTVALQAYQASNGGSFTYDLHYMGNCGRQAQWRWHSLPGSEPNTHICANSVLNQSAGPATKMLLYESAVGMMNLTV